MSCAQRELIRIVGALALVCALVMTFRPELRADMKEIIILCAGGILALAKGGVGTPPPGESSR